MYICIYTHTHAYIQTCVGTYIHIGMASYDCPGSGEKYTDPTWNPIEADRAQALFACSGLDVLCFLGG